MDMPAVAIVVPAAPPVCREMLGGETEDDENVGPYFNTVPRSLLTMFRCSFGDFSSRSGAEIAGARARARPGTCPA